MVIIPSLAIELKATRKQKTERANMPKTLLMLGNDEYHKIQTS